MKRITKESKCWDDLPIISIIEVSMSIFFTVLMLISTYLISSQYFRDGFVVLALSCIYFIANNVAKLKLLKATTWLVILTFSLKGLLMALPLI